MSTHEVEVEATDVVKIVLQFLKENSLTSSLQALQEETQVALNTVDNIESFMHDIQHGHWDAVMSVVATLKLPTKLLMDLYEQVRAARLCRSLLCCEFPAAPASAA
eukprot:6798289-Prymnesium_polylepis.2